MIRPLLRRLAAEYDEDMLNATGDVQRTVWEEVREDYMRALGHEPRTEMGDMTILGRTEMVMRQLRALALIAPYDGGHTRVWPSRARTLLTLVESWEE